MTDKPTPTDAEIDALWRFEASKNWGSTLAMRTSFTRAALAKWGTPQPAPATQQPEGDVVAYLDVGASGYLDLGSELSEDALQQLPKGRHALVIAGTYGIDGYVAAPQPSYTAQAADSVQEDAARWNAWSQAMVEGANSDTVPEFLRVLSGAIGDAELPITLQQFNAWIDVARARLEGKP